MEFDPAHIVLATLAVSLVLFVTDALRYDLIALSVAVALAATQVLSPEQAFAGIASPAVMLVGAMYVFGAAMTRSGLAERIGERFLGTRPTDVELVDLPAPHGPFAETPT